MLSAGGALPPMLAVLVCLAAALVAPAGGSDAPHGRAIGVLGRQIRWAAAGSAAIGALAMMWAGLGRVAGKAIGGPVAVGASVTAVEAPDGAGGTLPPRHRTRPDSEAARLARRILRLRPGRWRVISMAPSPPASDPAAGVRLSLHPADRAVARLPAWAGPAGWTPLAGRADVMEAGFDGVYIDAVPVAHPDAWSFCSLEAIRDARRRLGRGGVLMIRAFGGVDDLDRLIGLAGGLRHLVEGGFAAVSISGRGAEMLVVARFDEDAGALPAADAAAGDAYVVSLRELARLAGDRGPISAMAPGRGAGQGVGGDELARRLAAAAN